MSPRCALTLVGTVHRSGGEALLAELLLRERPEIVTLEMSPYALAFRRGRGPSLLARLDAILDRLAAETHRAPETLRPHPRIEAIRTLVALPFEYTAAAAYAEATGIPVDLIDSSLISARKLRRVERELITLENMRTLLTLEPESPQEDHRLARAMTGEKTDPAIRRAFLATRRGPEAIGERDRRMADAIRRRAAEGRRMVHIGGWIHLMEDEQKETLYERVRDLEPCRVVIG